MVSVLGIKFQSKYELIKARTITVKALEPYQRQREGEKKKKKKKRKKKKKKRRMLFTLINFIL